MALMESLAIAVLDWLHFGVVFGKLIDVDG
jgi:hypothetical protein